MPDSLETVFTTQDPDTGTLILGFFQNTSLYAAVLSTPLTTPLATSNVMIYDPPTDMNGSDYIEGSVTATAGNTTEDDIDQTFTYVQTKGFSFAGTLEALVNVSIDLDQVDAAYAGAARIESIICELLRYKISDGSTTQLGILTHTIGKDIAGIITTAEYAEQSLTEIFYFDVGVTPIEVGTTAGYLLQMRVKVNFSAYTNTSASTQTISKCRLNCFRDQTQNTILRVPVV